MLCDWRYLWKECCVLSVERVLYDGSYVDSVV